MAETHPKRLREEENSPSESSESNDSAANSKRQKPYTAILDHLLDEEEPTPSHEPSSHDLSAILTTLQQELSSPAGSAFDLDLDSFPSAAAEASAAADGGDESAESVMRRLLEASDDELGIPNTRDEGLEIGFGDNFPFAFGDNFPFGLEDKGLWEIEDEAANYYTVLQAELFM